MLSGRHCQIVFLSLIYFVLNSCQQEDTFQRLKRIRQEIVNDKKTGQTLISLSDTVVKLGDIRETDQIEYNIKIYNIGIKTYYLKEIITFCGCTSSKVTKNKMEPKDSIIFSVIIDPKNQKGKHYNKIFIVGNSEKELKWVLFEYVVR